MTERAVSGPVVTANTTELCWTDRASICTCMALESADMPTPLMKGRAMALWKFCIAPTCTVWVEVVPLCPPRSELNGRILAL